MREFQNGSYTAARQAVWGVTGNDDYILYSGEFVRVNSYAQQGLVRFARRDAAPNNEGPRLTEAAIKEIATISFLMNEQTENIGARRLHTILEKLLEDISFNIPDMDKDEIVIDRAYVQEKFMEKIHPEDMDKYIL